jgi:uncharacterized protein DUF2255
MATWLKDELRKIAEADDLHIAPFREDGVTSGTPTWIWSVAVDGALYVRACLFASAVVPVDDRRSAASSGAPRPSHFDATQTADRSEGSGIGLLR